MVSRVTHSKNRKVKTLNIIYKSNYNNFLILASYEEKKHLFDLYIERTEEAKEALEDTLVAFADAYDDSYMGTPTSQPATEI